MALQLQAPSVTAKSPCSLGPTGNAGLRQLPNFLPLKSSFLSGSLNLLRHPNQKRVTCGAPRISMCLASKQAYICRDCGYIYKDRTPFEKLPDNYFCPVCGAPKRRFSPYTLAVAKNANATDVRKARKAEIQRHEAIGKALPTCGIMLLSQQPVLGLNALVQRCHKSEICTSAVINEKMQCRDYTTWKTMILFPTIHVKNVFQVPLKLTSYMATFYTRLLFCLDGIKSPSYESCVH